MFKVGDIVRLNKWNDVLTLNKYDYQSYSIKRCRIMRAIYNDCYDILGLDDNIELSILDHRLNLDEQYYRRKKLEKLCSKLEKK